MDRMDAIRLFVRVVERGSFSAVAREAGVGQPAVSKQIAALEVSFGAQLMRRTSRQMVLTEAGETFYESAVRLVDDFEALRSSVGRGQSAPSGLIRVTVAPVFGRLYVVPRLSEFFDRFPDISIEMSASERRINLIEEGIDLAIRHSDLDDSSLTVRKLTTSPFVTVATPAYFDKFGIPATPGELEKHRCVIFSHQREPRPWLFEDTLGATVHHPRGNFRTADPEQIRAAVLADLGVAHVPGWLFASEIVSGAVRVVLRDFEGGSLAMSAVFPAARRLPTKVRLFIDFLAAAFARDPSLTLEQPASATGTSRPDR